MSNSILIVDDAKFARNIIKKALTNGGYDNFIEATSAKEAKELFESQKPELTLLDITLTDSSDLSLLEELLKINPQAKIIMNSAIGQDIIIADALKLGAKDFITKPFVEMEFLSVVQHVLEDD